MHTTAEEDFLLQVLQSRILQLHIPQQVQSKMRSDQRPALLAQSSLIIAVSFFVVLPDFATVQAALAAACLATVADTLVN